MQNIIWVNLKLQTILLSRESISLQKIASEYTTDVIFIYTVMNILELDQINISLAKKHILRDVSFQVKEGDMYGFLGPNGAGKTTTMKCILGLLTPQSWDIKIFWEKGLSKETRRKIWFMPENTYLYKFLTGKEFLRFNANFFITDEKKRENKIESLLMKVGLEDAGDKYLHEYSKGMLQRIGLAQSIINDPKLLFLDEPMSGLDPIGRKLIKDLMIELREKWTTIFFNTHILSDVQSICNTISIIYNGKIIVESEKVADIKEDMENFFMNQIENQKEKVPLF
mgnify:CR=1 FL=1